MKAVHQWPKGMTAHQIPLLVIWMMVLLRFLKQKAKLARLMYPRLI